jgi:hypothetical protein
MTEAKDLPTPSSIEECEEFGRGLLYWIAQSGDGRIPAWVASDGAATAMTSAAVASRCVIRIAGNNGGDW